MRNLSLCPDDKLWTRFLFDPELPEREQLKQHLSECPFCRLIVADISAELAEIENIWRANSLAIRLLPFSEDPALSGEFVLLAAEGSRMPESPLSMTLSSPEHNLFLRVVRDQHTSELWLYMISQGSIAQRRIIVKPFGEDREFVTDDSGRINLGKRDWPKPNQMMVEVRLPQATFMLTPFEYTEEHREIELTSPAGDRILVSLECREKICRLEIRIMNLERFMGDKPMKVAVGAISPYGLLQVQSLSSKRAVFEGIELMDKMEIYLYR